MSIELLYPNFWTYSKRDLAKVWSVNYEARAMDAREWALSWDIPPVNKDRLQVCLMLIDCQLTFCLPGFELVVSGAIGDMTRLCEFIYKYLGIISKIVASMDSHTALQIFYSPFLVDKDGDNPHPATQIGEEDVLSESWRIDPDIVKSIEFFDNDGENHLRYYVEKLKEGGKGKHTVWPFHAMLGGIEHALVPALHEAIFFHSVARKVNPLFELKGLGALTENYSVFSPEVERGVDGQLLGACNSDLMKRLQGYDMVIWAGEAGSHCVPWSISDYLAYLQENAPDKIGCNYILQDCTSAVVIPGVVDFTEQMKKEFERFAKAGMHIVRSTEPIENWPEVSI